MECTENKIIPFPSSPNEKMEINCHYDEKGHLIGEGKITDVYGNLLCEGIFETAPDDQKMSVSILRSGFVYHDCKKYNVSGFDGKNGYGAIIRGYSVFGLPHFDVAAGHYENGCLDGIGEKIDNVGTIFIGTFSKGKFHSGIKHSYRGTQHETKEEYEYIDYQKREAKAKISFNGENEMAEGVFDPSEFVFNMNGTLTSANNEDKFEGEFYCNGGRWFLVNGKGKWNGFEGEIVDKKPINAQGIFYTDYMSDDYFEGEWTEGLFTGEWIGTPDFPEKCPKCGKELNIFDDGKCKQCGNASHEISHHKIYKDGVIVEEKDVEIVK